MILNMMSAGNDAQILDFSLDEAFSYTSDNAYSIAGVRPPKNQVRGFLLSYLGGTYGNGDIFNMYAKLSYENVQSGVLTGYLYFVYWNGSTYTAISDTASMFTYDATAHTLSVKAGRGNVQLHAGNYRLVIW